MIRGMSSEIQDQALSESSNTETMQQENTAKSIMRCIFPNFFTNLKKIFLYSTVSNCQPQKVAELGSAGIGQLPQDSKQPSKWSCFLDPEDDN